MANNTKRRIPLKLDDYKAVIDETVTAIRKDPNILDHSGRLPALVNAWINLYKTEIESKDIKDILERLKKLEAGD